MSNFENNTLEELVVLGEALSLLLDEVLNEPRRYVEGAVDKVRAVHDDACAAFLKNAELRVKDDS